MDIETLYDKIYRYCFHRLGSREQAEDATQEAFTRLLADQGYREQGKAIRYLYTVARNLCADEYRRRRPGPLPECLAAPGSEDDRLERMALAGALAALTAAERELIFMRYVNQEPVSVIAGVLGISRFAVYRRTEATLKKLRTMLKEDIEP